MLQMISLLFEAMHFQLLSVECNEILKLKEKKNYPRENLAGENLTIMNGEGKREHELIHKHVKL